MNSLAPNSVSQNCSAIFLLDVENIKFVLNIEGNFYIISFKCFAKGDKLFAIKNLLTAFFIKLI